MITSDVQWGNLKSSLSGSEIIKEKGNDKEISYDELFNSDNLSLKVLGN